MAPPEYGRAATANRPKRSLVARATQSIFSGMTRRDPWAGILSGPVDGRARIRAAYPEVAAVTGLVVLHRSSGFTGKLHRAMSDGVVIRGSSGTERVFRYIPGAFEVEGRACALVRPTTELSSAKVSSTPVTASGSLAIPGLRARVAQASRILVEGVHDAELVERVWGDDLRIEGIVIERLDGLDDLAEVVRKFRPGPDRRLGVLVDHLVAGSKEWRIAETVQDPWVMVTGTPYVDVWAAVKPASVGIEGWPEIPQGEDWKSGVCRRLASPDAPTMWRRILASVNSYADLEAPLVGAVERLIDFVAGVAQ